MSGIFGESGRGDDKWYFSMSCLALPQKSFVMLLRNFAFFFFIAICVIFALQTSGAFAEPTHPILRIAIIDNFHTQKLSSEKYATYYLNGITAAVFDAKTKGVVVQYKFFPFGKSPLSILKILPTVKSWKPDLIIGPRSSNYFLLLKTQFTNIMVLSPFATANAVAQLPKNFYSLTSPDIDKVKAISQFLNENYHTKNVFILAQADCSSCVDTSKEFTQHYSGVNPNIKIINHIVLMDHVKFQPLGRLLGGYKHGDLIFLPDMSYQTAILMSRITDYLKQSVTFLGDDNWGSWKDGMVGKIKAKYSYVGFRIIPWSLDDRSKSVTTFSNRYITFFKEKPDLISYIAYQTVRSAVFAITQYPVCKQRITSVCVLASYEKALTKNPNWFRPKYYYLYQVDSSAEKYIERITTSRDTIA